MEFGRAMAVGGVDDVVLDDEVISNEISRIDGVRQDTTHLGGSEEDVFWFLFFEKESDGRGVEKIEFGASAEDEVLIAFRLQVAGDGRADKAAMAGDENTGRFKQEIYPRMKAD